MPPTYQLEAQRAIVSLSLLRRRKRFAGHAARLSVISRQSQISRRESSFRALGLIYIAALTREQHIGLQALKMNMDILESTRLLLVAIYLAAPTQGDGVVIGSKVEIRSGRRAHEPTYFAPRDSRRAAPPFSYLTSTRQAVGHCCPVAAGDTSPDDAVTLDAAMMTGTAQCLLVAVPRRWLALLRPLPHMARRD